MDTLDESGRVLQTLSEANANTIVGALQAIPGGPCPRLEQPCRKSGSSRDGACWTSAAGGRRCSLLNYAREGPPGSA